MIVNPGIRRGAGGIKNSYVMRANFNNSLACDRAGVSFTFTRASSKTYFNSSGTLQTAATNEPCYDYDPVTGAFMGLSIHEARTNSIRNNTMVGAAAGTPGTMPTNWAWGTLGTLSTSVIGTGTENGITYIDVRINGTTSTTNGRLKTEATDQIVATSGQTWTGSTYLAIVAGSISNITSITLDSFGRNAGDTTETESFSSSDVKGTITSSLKAARVQLSSLLASGSTARIVQRLALNFSSGVAIDITLRIGMPQLENIPATATTDKASPVIATSGAAATRAADVCSLSGADFSSWYNQPGGTFSVVARIDYVPIASTFGRVFDCRDAGFTSSINCVIFNRAGNAHSFFGGRQASVAQFSIDTSNVGYDLTPGTPFRRTISYETNNAQACADRATLLTDTVCVQPTPDRLYIGSLDGSNAFLNGHIQLISYYNRPLNNLILSV